MHHRIHPPWTEEALAGLHDRWQGGGRKRSSPRWTCSRCPPASNCTIYRARPGLGTRRLGEGGPDASKGPQREPRLRPRPAPASWPRPAPGPASGPAPAPPLGPAPSGLPCLPSGSRWAGPPRWYRSAGVWGRPRARASPRRLVAGEAHGARSPGPCRVRPFLYFPLLRVSIFFLRRWGWAWPGGAPRLGHLGALPRSPPVPSPLLPPPRRRGWFGALRTARGPGRFSPHEAAPGRAGRALYPAASAGPGTRPLGACSPAAACAPVLAAPGCVLAGRSSGVRWWLPGQAPVVTRDCHEMPAAASCLCLGVSQSAGMVDTLPPWHRVSKGRGVCWVSWMVSQVFLATVWGCVHQLKYTHN